MSEPIRLEKADFYELKAMVLEAELAQRDARGKEQTAQAKLRELLIAQGADPEQRFRLDDALCALVSA
jgi:hypothetical protein